MLNKERIEINNVENILKYIINIGFKPTEGCEIYQEKFFSYGDYDIEINKNKITFFVNGIEVFTAKNYKEYCRLFNIVNNILNKNP